MSNKFVEVTGLHKVFPVSGNTLDLTSLIPDTPFSSDSILFMTADATDETYGFDEGSTYIWARGRIYYTSDDEITSGPPQLLETDSFYIDTYTPVITMRDTGVTTEYQLDPNVLYKFINRTTDLTLSLSPEQENKTCEYHMIIKTGSDAPTINWPNNVTFAAGYPNILANTTYEVSILDGIAVYI